MYNLQQIELSKNKQIKAFDINSKLQTNYGIYLNIGISKIEQGFYMDFNFDSILVANKKQVKWGIDCPDLKNKCEVLNDEQFLDYYLYSAYQFEGGKIPLSFDNLDSNKDQQFVELKLISKTINSWPLELNGVIGFSPQSTFANFIRNNFKDNNAFLFFYKPKYNPQIQTDKLKFQTIIYQNPSFKRDNHLARFKLDKDEKYWNFQADITIDKVGLNLTNQKVCLQNSYNDILFMRDSQIYCRKIISLICKDENVLNCNKSNTDISKAPELKFKVGDAEIVFEGNEYLFYDEKSNRVNCRFNWIISVRSNDCDEETDIAVGRLFYSKLQPVLQYNQDGSSEIIFTKDFNIKNKADWKFVIIGICITLFVLFLIACILHAKKKNEDDKYFIV